MKIPWNLAAAYGRPSIDLIFWHSGLPAFTIIEAAKLSSGKACLRVKVKMNRKEIGEATGQTVTSSGNWKENRLDSAFSISRLKLCGEEMYLLHGPSLYRIKRSP
ncbi:hypothetical protein F2Q68_00026879 [Brassica cretica]|uniref:Uncharacterized protein n=1 Tax=Brassica cretica TaxID=69181 RepID=A0A8S9IJI4_BRACR|nr:hypothetical protein F2Q68_00026879 [Brassica cretica]